MSDRDELVDAIWRADDNGPNTPQSERIADAIRAKWRLVPVEEDAQRPDYYRGYRDAEELAKVKVRAVVAGAVADGKQIDAASRSGSIATTAALVETYAFALDEIARIVGYEPTP